jgi:hypothetical protein
VRRRVARDRPPRLSLAPRLMTRHTRPARERRVLSKHGPTVAHNVLECLAELTHFSPPQTEPPPRGLATTRAPSQVRDAARPQTHKPGCDLAGSPSTSSDQRRFDTIAALGSELTCTPTSIATILTNSFRATPSNDHQTYQAAVTELRSIPWRASLPPRPLGTDAAERDRVHAPRGARRRPTSWRPL